MSLCGYRDACPAEVRNVNVILTTFETCARRPDGSKLMQWVYWELDAPLGAVEWEEYEAAVADIGPSTKTKPLEPRRIPQRILQGISRFFKTIH